MEIAKEAFFLLIARTGHGDQRAGIGRDDHRDLAMQTQAQDQVVLGQGVLDLGDARRRAVDKADDALLHVRRQSGHGAAGNARLGKALLPVSRELQDRTQFDLGVTAKDLEPPKIPTAPIGAQVLRRDGDVLAGGGGAAR